VKCEWHVHRRFLSGFLFLHFLIHHVLYRWIWLVCLWISQRITFFFPVMFDILMGYQCASLKFCAGYKG
jgi:hypothetical protein